MGLVDAVSQTSPSLYICPPVYFCTTLVTMYSCLFLRKMAGILELDEGPPVGLIVPQSAVLQLLMETTWDGLAVVSLMKLEDFTDPLPNFLLFNQ